MKPNGKLMHIEDGRIWTHCDACNEKTAWRVDAKGESPVIRVMCLKCGTVIRGLR
jgi:RNase P subunit RPR2